MKRDHVLVYIIDKDVLFMTGNPNNPTSLDEKDAKLWTREEAEELHREFPKLQIRGPKYPAK